MSEPKNIFDPSLKPGDDIDMGHGLVAKMASQEEIDEQSKKGEMIFACVPVKWGPAPIPGTRQMDCSECRQKVWMSPATHATWEPQKAPILCLECITNKLKEEKDGGT